MRYRALCCGVIVLGRLVWIALGVTRAIDECPACRRWTTFVPEKPVFGQREKAA